MKLYSWLRMPAPEIQVQPVMSLRSGAITYYVKIGITGGASEQGCATCHNRYALLRHKLYLELYPKLPFMCAHDRWWRP